MRGFHCLQFNIKGRFINVYFVISWHTIFFFLHKQLQLLFLQHLPFSSNHFHSSLQQAMKFVFTNEETWVEHLCFYSPIGNNRKFLIFSTTDIKDFQLLTLSSLVIVSIFINSNFRREEINSGTVSRQNVTVLRQQSHISLLQIILVSNTFSHKSDQPFPIHSLLDLL